jgi:pimeloyl-ACP methyl ester carboxylesterase
MAIIGYSNTDVPKVDAKVISQNRATPVIGHREGILLRGDPSFASFVFLHGLGSSEADLYPLACALHALGHTCEIVYLPIHADNIGQAYMLCARHMLENLHSTLSKYNGKVFLVGFSTGAALALLYAATHEVAGICAISTFFSPYRAKAAKFAAAVSAVFPRIPLPRRSHTTKKETRNELVVSPTLPIGALRLAIDLGEEAFRRIQEIACPILFFHSFNDKVSSYGSVASAVRLCSATSRLVTLSCLKHYVQFDIPIPRICAFIYKFFGIKKITEENPNANAASGVEQLRAYAEILRVYNDEKRHWALILFQVIAGALAIFALMMYSTLGDVMSGSDKSPYILISYSIIASFYVTMAILYLFYVNRLDAYIKMFVEPLIRGVSWVTFRTNSFVSGSESPNITRLSTIPLVMLPIILGFGALGICAVQYMSQIFVIQSMTWPLAAFWMIAFFLSVYSLLFAIRHSGFGRRWLYLIPAPEETDQETETLLQNLFRSISPGCVRQPESFWSHVRKSGQSGFAPTARR